MQKTIDFINKQIKDFKPEIGIVLGSGLGDLADEFCEITIPFLHQLFKDIKDNLFLQQLMAKK